MGIECVKSSLVQLIESKLIHLNLRQYEQSNIKLSRQNRRTLVCKLVSSSNQRETQLPGERKSRWQEEISVSLKPLGISLMSINGCPLMLWSTQHASNLQPFNLAQRSWLPGFMGYILHLVLSFSVVATRECPADGHFLDSGIGMLSHS